MGGRSVDEPSVPFRTGKEIVAVERGMLDDLSAFTAVARHRSFTRAAPDVGLTVSALSHVIKRLEKRLDVRLLQRNSRSVAPTSAGARLLDRLATAFEDVERALMDLDLERGSVTGVIRMTMTRQAYEAVIRPIIREFSDRHPKARIEVLIEYEFRDIVAASLDAGIRMGYKLEQDMIALPVGPELRMAVVGSPGYLAVHPAPSAPSGLSDHFCIRYRMRAGGPVVSWEFDRDDRVIAIDVSGPLTVNEPELAIDAALDGLGLAYVLEERVASHIKAGRLVRLLDDWLAPFAGFHLYYPSRRQMQPTLAALIQILRERKRRETAGTPD